MHLLVAVILNVQDISIMQNRENIPFHRWPNKYMCCIQALGQNQAAFNELEQQLACAESLSCTGVCETSSSGTCFFPEFVDFSDFVTSRTPFCNFIRRNIECARIRSPSLCTGGCVLDNADGELCAELVLYQVHHTTASYQCNPVLI